MKVAHDDGVLHIALERNLAIATWADAPRAVQLHKLRRVLEGMHAEHGDTFGLHNVICGGTPDFSAETRTALARLVGDPALQGRGIAHVFLVGGLAGAAARVFLGTALLVGKASPQHRIFPDTRAAAAWLAPRISGPGRLWTASAIETLARGSRR